MNIEVRAETLNEFDGRMTSHLAYQAFGRIGPELSSERFSWAYKSGYDRVTIISAFTDGIKIGQLVSFSKTLCLAGRSVQAAELVDLFVSPEFRGMKVAGKLYKTMRDMLERDGIAVLYTYANQRASYLNRRHLGLEESTQLPAYIGLHLNLRSSKQSDVTICETVDEIAAACTARTNAASQNGVTVTAEQLARRISSPIHKYVSAHCGDVAIIGSPRVVKSVPLLLICATFTTLDRPPDNKTVRMLTSALCGASDREIFLYAGWNDAFNFEHGFRVPGSLFQGRLVIQSNFLDSRRNDFGRFELIDIDYA